MRCRARLFSVGLTLAFVTFGAVSAEAARAGRLSGVVRDQAGVPLGGATIAIFDAIADSERPVQNARTDAEGKFVASIAPGRYLLRAVASGFTAVEARALVAANRETVINSLALRRVDTLSDRRRQGMDPYREAVLSARGHILNFEELEKQTRKVESLALTDTSRSTHGVVQTVAASGASSDYIATNFAVSQRLLGSDLTVAGQTGLGEGAPSRLEAVTAADVGEDHRVSVTLGYGKLATPNAASSAATPRSQLAQFSLQATDTWQVAGPLVLVYGFNYTRFTGAADADALLPRFGLEVSPSARTQVFARLTPGASLTEVARFDLETGEVTFTEPAAAAPAVRDGSAVADRSRRFEVGVGHLIDEQSNVEVMAFVDTATGHGIGFLAVPADAPGEHEFTTGELSGRTSGLRVVYTRKFNDVLTGTVGYAVGRGMRVSASGLADPASMFEPATFNMLAARLDADFASGTRISAVYRVGPDAIVFAIDPFAGKMTAFTPSASIFIAQPIPSFGFLPGQWEATLDLRNIFDIRRAVDEDLSIAEYSRFVRAGVALRF
jgi:hypothetical protein